MKSVFVWITQWSGQEGPPVCCRGPPLTQTRGLHLLFSALTVGRCLHKRRCRELEKDRAGPACQAAGGWAAAPVRPSGFWGEIRGSRRKCPKGWVAEYRGHNLAWTSCLSGHVPAPREARLWGLGTFLSAFRIPGHLQFLLFKSSPWFKGWHLFLCWSWVVVLVWDSG